MCRLFRVLVVNLLLFSSGPIGSKAFGAEISCIQKGHKCSWIKDRVKRLLCFDDLFKSTLEQAQAESVPQVQEKKKGPIRLMATMLEDQRAPGEKNWIMRARPWYQAMLLAPLDYDQALAGGANRHSSESLALEQGFNAEKMDVFMTMRESDIPADRSPAEEAVLMLSCENDITTLGVLLPKPIMTLQANLSLSAGSGSLLKLNWRDVENGNVIIAGRGLESIDTIKTIANYDRVRLQVTYPEGARSFAFDMHDLKDRLKPLRTACHW